MPRSLQWRRSALNGTAALLARQIQNGCVESFYGRLHDELPNETLFLSIAHARVETSAWIEDYNRERAQGAFGYRTPAGLAADWIGNGLLRYALRAPLRKPSLQPPRCLKQLFGSNTSWRKWKSRNRRRCSPSI